MSAARRIPVSPNPHQQPHQQPPASRPRPRELEEEEEGVYRPRPCTTTQETQSTYDITTVLLNGGGQSSGSFDVKFNTEKNFTFFGQNLSKCIANFSAKGDLKFSNDVDKPNLTYKGQFKATCECDKVLGFIQWSVNKTFQNSLSLFNYSAAMGGEGVATVTSCDLTSRVPRAFARDGDPVVRNLHIVTDKSLTKNVKLMLTFNDPDNKRLYFDQFPIAWKVISFAAQTNGIADVTYIAQLATFAAQFNQSTSMITATSWTDVGLGDDWQLNLVDNAYTFTKLGSSGSGTVNVQNNISARSDIGIGFDVRGVLNTAVVQTSIGYTNSAQFEFHPVLSAFITSDYIETELISSDIIAPKLWSQNLVALGISTTLTLTEDATGRYNLS